MIVRGLIDWMEEKHGRIGSLDGARAERGSHEPTPAAKRRIAVDRSPERVPARSMEGLPREGRGHLPNGRAKR